MEGKPGLAKEFFRIGSGISQGIRRHKIRHG
jgi:hypothetical protein